MYIDDGSRLLHMLDAGKQACEFIKDRKRDDLEKDALLMHALIKKPFFNVKQQEVLS